MINFTIFRAVGEADPGSLLSIYVDALTALKVDQGTQKGSPFPSVTVLYINKTGDFYDLLLYYVLLLYYKL